MSARRSRRRPRPRRGAPRARRPPGRRRRARGSAAREGPRRPDRSRGSHASRRVPPGRPRFSASAQVSSRTRGREVRVRLETCALAEDDEPGRLFSGRVMRGGIGYDSDRLGSRFAGGPDPRYSRAVESSGAAAIPAGASPPRAGPWTPLRAGPPPHPPRPSRSPRPPRNGAMTPRPGRAGAGAHPKVTRQPPSPTPATLPDRCGGARPERETASREDRSHRHPGCAWRFPRDCAVVAATRWGAGRNDPPKAPESESDGTADRPDAPARTAPDDHPVADSAEHTR